MRPERHIQLASTLPRRLTEFFSRFPPQATLPAAERSPESSSPTESSDISSSASTTPLTDLEKIKAFEQSSYNPFLPRKNPVTGKWRDPVYSLRRQAELVKLARQHNVEQLLPFTVKGTEERLRRRMENGLRVKGTGVGQRVKGKESERTMKGRLEKRRQAMLEMPQMIQTWKERGHGRGWKKWPK